MVQRGQSIAGTTIDFPVLVDKFIIDLVGAHRFGFAQEQVAARRQRESKLVEHVILEFGCEVNEHVSAQHQVDTWEGCAAAEVLLPKYHHLPQRFRNTISVVNMLEETVAVLSLYALEQIFGVQAPPGKVDSRFIEIGGKNFYTP